MQFRKYIRRNNDWIILLASVLLVAAIAVAVSIFLSPSTDKPSDQRRLYTYNEDETGLQEIVPPAPEYPPPAKEQLAFYKTYGQDAFQFSVEWSVRNRGRDAKVGTHTFTISVTNTRNKTVRPRGSELKSVSIGCIAKESPYRPVTPDEVALDFAPMEKKVLKIDIDVSCLYLGTADGRYFWRIY